MRNCKGTDCNCGCAEPQNLDDSPIDDIKGWRDCGTPVLAKYAKVRIAAYGARLAGRIPQAIRLEAVLDDIYDNWLDDSQRW